MRVYAVTLLKFPWTNKGVDNPREQTPALQRAGVDSLPGNERCQPVRLASPGKPLYGGYMRFSQENIEGNSISAFASGQVTVNGEAITTSVIVTPTCIIRDWLPAVFAMPAAPLPIMRMSCLRRRINSLRLIMADPVQLRPARVPDYCKRGGACTGCSSS